MVYRLLWDRAESDLGAVDPVVVVQLKRSAERVLHAIPPRMHPPYDEGISGGIMWHRATIHATSDESFDRPQNYFLFYRTRADQEFEILRVCSIYEVANRYASQMELPYRARGEWRPALKSLQLVKTRTRSA